MEIANSARKHGIPESDIRHALRNIIVFFEQDVDGSIRGFVIGPDASGGLLEIVVLPADQPTLVIHADRLRPKFFPLLRR